MCPQHWPLPPLGLQSPDTHPLRHVEYVYELLHPPDPVHGEVWLKYDQHNADDRAGENSISENVNRMVVCAVLILGLLSKDGLIVTYSTLCQKASCNFVLESEKGLRRRASERRPTTLRSRAGVYKIPRMPPRIFDSSQRSIHCTNFPRFVPNVAEPRSMCI